MSTDIAKQQNGIATGSYSSSEMEQFRINCENFLTRLNAEPTPESIGKTPDGKAKTIAISHTEMTLDEFFFGLWDTEHFRWERIANEIVGAIDLVVVHPVTGRVIRRTGAASIQIMTDAVPDELKNDRKAKNRWQLDMENKKSNSLDMGFPKLKSECLKNAAQSFGKRFGRDLNREIKDNYSPLVGPAAQRKHEQERVKALIEETTELKHLTNDLWEAANTHGLIGLFNEKRKALGGE